MRRQRKPKRRKRQTPATRFEFTVAAKNAESLHQITRQALEHKLKSYRKGSATNRLYFTCTDKQWSKFHSEIKHLCVVDNAGHCPNRLRRRMVQHLRLAARSKINHIGARIAKQMLEVIDPAKREHAEHSKKACPALDGVQNSMMS
ncbi:MAG: hypothetical protein CEE38_06115 [Planctomycetes bacterium B3_Pla]|nr:MAG: hypothetical protein CEE38_06115 [Planctomycetes bacterium B3_Pla]